jgi:hypothetical protein
MKATISLFAFAVFSMTFLQAISQSQTAIYSKKIKEICTKIDGGRTAEALEQAVKLKVPLNSKNAKFFICHTFLKSYLKKSSGFTEVDARNMFDTTLIGSALFKATPEGRKKQVMKCCPRIDKNGQCFTDLEKFWLDTLCKLSGQTSAELLQSMMDSMESSPDTIDKKVLDELKSIDQLRVELEKTKNDLKLAKTMLGDTLKKSTIRQTTFDMKGNPRAKDSVFISFKVHEIDSIEMQIYLVTKNPSNFDGIIAGKYEALADFCNPKVNWLVENGTLDILARWSEVFKTDTLQISVTILGEADDIWLNEGELETFKDCFGIGAQMGLKPGDKISNDTIAKLRALNAQHFFKEGVKKTESLKKVKISVESVTLASKDWRQYEGKNEGAEWRKETIVLKCHNER